MISKQDLIEEIEKTKARNSLIIVEGKKDKNALENIGLKNIFILNEDGKSLFVKIEEIAGKNREKDSECVILTDFDKKGRKIYNLLKKEFSEKGIKMNNTLRDLLLKAHLSHIEGTATFLENFSYSQPR